MKVPCRELIPALEQEVLARGARARFTVAGSSMSPFLRDGDTVELAALGDRPVHVGDVILARVADEAYVMHRVARVTAAGIYLLGDAQHHVDGPLARSQLVGRVTRAWRGSRPVHAVGPFWRATGRLWGACPGPRATALEALRRCRRALRRLARSDHPGGGEAP